MSTENCCSFQFRERHLHTAPRIRGVTYHPVCTSTPLGPDGRHLLYGAITLCDYLVAYITILLPSRTHGQSYLCPRCFVYDLSEQFMRHATVDFSSLLCDCKKMTITGHQTSIMSLAYIQNEGKLCICVFFGKSKPRTYSIVATIAPMDASTSGRNAYDFEPGYIFQFTLIMPAFDISLRICRTMM